MLMAKAGRIDSHFSFAWGGTIGRCRLTRVRYWPEFLRSKTPKSNEKQPRFESILDGGILDRLSCSTEIALGVTARTWFDQKGARARFMTRCDRGRDEFGHPMCCWHWNVVDRFRLQGGRRQAISIVELPMFTRVRRRHIVTGFPMAGRARLKLCGILWAFHAAVFLGDFGGAGRRIGNRCCG